MFTRLAPQLGLECCFGQGDVTFHMIWLHGVEAFECPDAGQGVSLQDLAIAGREVTMRHITPRCLDGLESSLRLAMTYQQMRMPRSSWNQFRV